MNKVIFLHILKTGGTSLRYMLLEQYGAGQIAPVPVGRVTGLAYPTLAENSLVYQASITPEMVADYAVVMSHYDWRITERLPDWPVLTVFRHPVTQLHSTFRFMQRNRDLRQRLGVQATDFEAWLHDGESQRYRNTQTRYLSAHGMEDIDAALRNLESDRLTFGLLERFDESIALFNRKFGWQMRPRHDNAASSRQRLPDDIWAQAEIAQADDMRLYEKVCDLFEQQVT